MSVIPMVRVLLQWQDLLLQLTADSPEETEISNAARNRVFAYEEYLAILRKDT